MDIQNMVSDCTAKDHALFTQWRIPSNFMFHMIRYAHIAPSRINCDQCQELFGFGKPGYDLILLVLAYSEDKKQRIRLP